MALRATLIVLPALLLALIDPASYLPIILKVVSLGQQSSTMTARNAARELLGSALFGGLLAILFWYALGQSVQDSVAGKDVYTAFAVRMGLFIVVSLYACLMVHLLDQHRRVQQHAR